MFRQATLLLQERKRSNAAFRESGNTKHKDERKPTDDGNPVRTGEGERNRGTFS